MEELISLRKMMAVSWWYLLALVLGSWLLVSWSFAWAVLAGGIISIVSFRVSYRDVMHFTGTLAPNQEQGTVNDIATKSKKGFIVKFWLRIFLIGLILLLLIKYGGINVFGLILGLTTVVFTVTAAAVGVVWRYYFSRR